MRREGWALAVANSPRVIRNLLRESDKGNARAGEIILKAARVLIDDIQILMQGRDAGNDSGDNLTRELSELAAQLRAAETGEPVGVTSNQAVFDSASEQRKDSTCDGDRSAANAQPERIDAR